MTAKTRTANAHLPTPTRTSRKRTRYASTACVRPTAPAMVRGPWSTTRATLRPTIHATTKPTNVGASSDTAGELMLTWEGGDNADSYLLIAVNMADTSDYKTMRLSVTAPPKWVPSLG